MQPNTERSSAGDRIEKKRREIRDAMAGLGRRIKQGEDVDLVHWIIPGELACAHRHLRYDQRYGGSRRPLPPDATNDVRAWAELTRDYYGKSLDSEMAFER